MTPPSNLVYTQTAINAAVEFPITPDTPTVTGAVASFSVAPTLPSGMTFNATTGVISGTPTATAAKANYTVTASNAGGLTTTVVQIAVAVTAPANLAYPQTTISATAGVAIQPDIPTVEGLVTGYSVSPALPSGLSLDSTTGAITGTPTASAAQATYVITASNGVGVTTASVQITVTLAAPSNLAYPQTTINATTGTAISPDVPNVTGLVSAYSVSPALPAGLTFSTSTGAIAGTPTIASAKTSYTVTASNSAGSTTATVQITVTQSPPSNLVYPVTTINATAGSAIAADIPTVVGLVTGYTVSPALPAGLTFGSSTGEISGTPTAASATTTYTVTASNSAGSITATLQITVAQPAPPSNLVYPQATIQATVGIPIVSDAPTVSGLVTGYSTSPALPGGLSLDTSKGTISGTPTVASAQTTYTVTAQNGGGSTTAQVTIAVAGAPVVLYQGGHQTSIGSMHSNSDRLLSSDESGVWILWDFSSGNIVAQGTGATQSDLEGQTFAVDTGEGLQVRSTLDGSLIFTVPGVLSFDMPSDGSYVCTVSSSQLTIWSPTGGTEVVRSGDYSKATIFAATGQVQVAHGPAGQSVIETIDVATGTSTVSPTYLGTFSFWFADGSHFVTTFSAEYWVYSNAGVQQAGGTLPQNVSAWSGGVGTWLWTGYLNPGLGEDFSIFAIGATTPTQTFVLPYNSTFIQENATVVALDEGYPDLSIVDLSTTTPTVTKFNLPDTETSLTAYTKNSSGEWAVGNQFGVVMDATNLSSPVTFDYGEVIAIAAGGNTAAVATGSGTILLYDITTAQQTGTINSLANKMQMSSDGTVLAATEALGNVAYVADGSLNVYSLPSLATIASYPYTYGNGTPVLLDFSLSASGTTLEQTLTSPSTDWVRQVTGVNGLPLIWSDSGTDGIVYLSPDGTTIAATSDSYLDGGTDVYQNGTRVAAFNHEVPTGFIDNNHLLIETSETFEGMQVFWGDAIYDTSGTLIKTLPYPGGIPDTLQNPYGVNIIIRPQFPSTDSEYWAGTNAIYSLIDGSVIWQGPQLQAPIAAVAGSNVIYYTGSQVQVVPVN